MTKNLKGILKILLFVILATAMVLGLSRLFIRKDSDEKYADFFSQEQDFDVLFFGSSHMLNAVYPMELWDDYGIISYNFGGHGNYIPVSYWIMRNALDYTNPKVVVFDVGYIKENELYRTDAQQIHISSDCFPLSRTKYHMIMELFGPEESKFHYYRYEYLFPFTTYHSRWAELTADDFNPVNGVDKGGEMRIDVAWDQSPSGVMQTDMDDSETNGKFFLRRLITECQEQGIQVVLVNLPRAVPDDEQRFANSAALIAAEYNVPFINFTYSGLIDWNLDFYDTDGHLNPAGAAKITDYLGDFLITECDVPNRKGDSQFSFWNQDYQEFKEEKVTRLLTQETLETYLMLLSDDMYSCHVEVKDDSEFLNDPRVTGLLEKLEAKGDVVELCSKSENAPEFIVEVWTDGQMIDRAMFEIVQAAKPRDENLDQAVYFANGSYKRQ